MVSDRRDAGGRYVACTVAFLFDDEVAVGFALDKGEKDFFSLRTAEAKLTEDGAYPVRLKINDGETLVTGDVTSDNRMLIVPLQKSQKWFQKFSSAGALSVEVNQEATSSG